MQHRSHWSPLAPQAVFPEGGGGTTSIESGPVELLEPEELCELRVIGALDSVENVLTPLMTSRTLIKLTSLTMFIPSDARDLFCRFVQLCPSVQSLNVISQLGVIASQLLFQPVIAPNLRTYRGPSGLVEALIPGRPINTVYLAHGLVSSHPACDLASLKSIFDHLSQSIVPIITLELPTMSPGLDIFSLILAFFPVLNALTMTFKDKTPLRPISKLCYDTLSEDSDTGDGELVSTYGHENADVKGDLGVVTETFRITENTVEIGISNERPRPNEKPSGQEDAQKKIKTRKSTKIPLDSQGHPVREADTFAVRIKSL